MRLIVLLAWPAFLAAPVTMIIGHLGMHELHWAHNQISTYAAQAPNDHWITASMLLSATTLLCIGILFSAQSACDRNPWARLVSLFFGAAAAGLLFIAYFEETAANIPQLKTRGLWAVRQQSFHDAGLLLFFHAAILALMSSGFMVMIKESTWLRRILGFMVGLSGPAAYGAMIASWPQDIGVLGMTAGLKQRAALLCLWIGVGLLLALETKGFLRKKRGLLAASMRTNRSI